MATSTAFPSPLLTCAFQIHDYLKAANLPYPSTEAETIVTSIVDERFRPAAMRKPTSRTTQRAQSSEPPAYPTAWAVDRSQLTANIKTFVAKYNTWKAKVVADKKRSKTVTPPRKSERNYSIGTTPISSSFAPREERYYSVTDTDLDSISRRLIQSIEKSSSVGNPSNSATETNNFGNFSQKLTSTPPSTAMPGWKETDFTEQQ